MERHGLAALSGLIAAGMCLSGSGLTLALAGHLARESAWVPFGLGIFVGGTAACALGLLTGAVLIALERR